MPVRLEANVAVTFALAPLVSVNWQLFPEHAPLYPEKLESVAVVEAVRVTAVPLAKLAVHVEGQLIPLGLLITVPCPEIVTAT